MNPPQKRSNNRRKSRAEAQLTTLTSVFAHVASRSPQAAAVEDAGQSLTYAELDALSERIARQLAALGVEAGTRIGVSMDRSVGLVAMLLGIVKAGCAYVPLDRGYPESRLHFMLADSGAGVVVSGGGDEWLDAENVTRLLYLGGELCELGGSPIAPATVRAQRTGQSATYVMYTSGSTGKPKGVVASDWAIVSLVRESADIPIEPDDVLLQLAPSAFDASTFEIWAALLNGAKLAVAPSGRLSSRDIADTIARHRVTLLWISTPLFHLIVDERLEGLQGLRCLVVGGDALSLIHARRYLEQPWSRQLINVYGPTETTTFSHAYGMREWAHGTSTVPIGFPIGQRTAYVLDENQEPQTIGAPGELHIGGAGVAHGYWGRAGLTAERFLPDPYGEPGQRMYRSGDSVRQRADGAVEFLGRLDTQVKIQGYRVELEEIEQVLRAHDQIWDAAVTAAPAASGQKRLVAFMTTAPGGSLPGKSELQAYVRERLPHYMVPGQFVALERLPLTVSGKLDRANLPVDSAESLETTAYEAPQGAVEEYLAKIWAEVLGVARVGRNDNFFELGGDSIRSIQVKGLAEEGSLSFEMLDLFDYPVLSALAARVRTNDGTTSAASGEAPAETPTLSPIEDSYPLCAMQSAMLYHSARAAGSSIYHDLYHVDLEGPYAGELLSASLNQVLRCHPVLRTAFHLGATPDPLQVVYRDVTLALHEEDWRQQARSTQDEAYATWLSRESRLDFDPERVPLLRAFVHRFDDVCWRLTLSFHHALLDGWSLRTLMSELWAGYSNRLTGVEVSDKPPRARYRQFIEQERAALVSWKDESFWQKYLGDSSFLYFAPDRFFKPPASVVREGIPVDPETGRKIKSLARELGVPLKSVLLAGHFAALASHLGRAEVVSGTLSHGRPSGADGDRVAGLFVNALPLRIRTQGCTWMELARRVYQQERRCWAHRNFPYAGMCKLSGQGGLIDTAFNFTRFIKSEKLSKLAGLKILGDQVYEHSSYPLVLQVAEDPSTEELFFQLECDPALIPADKVRELTNAYALAYGRMTSDSTSLCTPASSPSNPKKLSPAEASLTMNTGPDMIFEHFDRIARARGHATAVVDPVQSYSYDELSARVHRLASHLASQGVGVEDLVAVPLPRSMELVVCVLALWKLRAVYVPLDAEHPDERLRQIITESNIRWLLTHSESRGRFAELAGDTALQIVSADEAPERERADRCSAVAGNLQSLAYIIHTSGSTGRPKATAVTHAGVLNLVEQQRAILGAGPAAAVTLFASTTFDASIFEMVMALLTGARLCVVEESCKRDPQALATFLADQGVGILTLPPTYLAVLEPAKLAPSLTIVTAGEQLPLAVARRFENRVRLVNCYGPTEASVWTTYFECHASEEQPPIGRPIGNVGAYVLDEDLAPVPPGGSGTLYIRGVALARGYVNSASRTAASFLPDPFSDIPGDRMYGTGDLVRLLEDGSLVFLGRADRQIKLRGYRIELDEVEGVLLNATGVSAGAVIVKERDDASLEMVAYVIADEAVTTPEKIREFLRSKLPEYMCPQHLIPLTALPLTSSGKIDRQILRTYDVEQAANTLCLPTNEIEAALVDVWQEVLRRNPVSIDDQFYDLGGDSILSIQLKARARERGYDFELEDLFKLQSIRRLAPRTAVLGRQEAFEPEAPFALVDDATRAALEEFAEDAYPVSQMQMGMLFHLHYEPGSGMYHDVMHYRFRGSLDAKRLESALGELTQEQPILRTAFELSRFSLPVQVVHKNAPSQFEHSDLRGMPAEEQGRVLEGWATAARNTVFDLTKPSLLQVALHVLSDDEFQLSLCCPHAILDGWSVATLTTELLKRCSGRPGTVHGGGVKFADFIALERQAMLSTASAEFWAEQMRDAPCTRLPALARSGAPQEPWRKTLTLPADLQEKLARVAAESATSLKAVLFAIHVHVMSLLTGDRDVTCGMVINGRPEQKDAHNLLGLFLNSLPIRVRNSQGSWRDLVRAASAAIDSVWAHRRYPLSQIISGLDATPFDTLFNFTHFHVLDEIEELGFTLQGLAGYEYSNYAMVCQAGMHAHTGDLRLMLDFDRAAVTPEQGEVIGELYCAVASALANDAGALRTVELPEPMRAALLSWGSGPRAEALPEGGLWELFAAQAQHTPAAIAVEDEQERVSYGELLARSEALAQQLSGAGVRGGTRVALSVERSVGMITTLLAIVRAGGTYVPLDGSCPPSRLRFMLEDAAVSVLIGEEDSSWADQSAVRCLKWVQGELRDAQGTRVSAAPVRAARSADSAAYVMYTSGSSGTPKGVVVSDRGIVRLVRGSPTLRIEAHDVLLQLAPSAFDASTYEIWGALLNGARLAMARRGQLGLGEIGAQIERYQVSVLWLTAPLFHLMVDERLEGLRGVRRVLAGGDALSVAHVKRYLQGAGDAELINGYGPTEATTFSCCYTLKEWEEGLGSVPIGVPIGHSSAYVLDEQQRLVPVGTPGELYVGGAGVSQGYWGRAALTAEKFLPDPFSDAPGERLYRTGDRVRYLPDGRLEFLGRIDEQLKVRGYRIEPGEIEQALRAHESVRDALVLMRELEPGKKQLVAYLAIDTHLPVAQWREYLSERVPEYMVPALFVQLEQLPLTANGKVDRQALPAPHASLTAARLYEPPQGATEEKLAQIWSEVLGVAAVGREDNFFELGGDSILSIQVKARAQEQGLDFALEDLFERQTIARLAQAIDGGAVTPSAEITPTAPFELIDASIRAQLPAQVEDAYPLSAMQLAMIYHSERAPDSGLYHDVISYRVPLAFEAGAFGQTLRSLTARHEVLRTGFELTRYGQPLQLVYREGEIDWEVVDLRACSVGEQQTRLQEWINREHLRPFAPGAWPWLRVVVHQLDGESFRLGWSFHHAVLDGWSEAALTTELIGTYAQALQGRCPARPALGVKYRQFVALEQRACTDERVVQFWAQQAQRARPTQLPERLLEQSGPARRLLEAETGLHGMIEITAAQTVALRKLARELDVPLKTVLLAVHLKVLSVACGQLQVTSGLITHGRVEAVQSEEAMGLFLNTLPMTLAVRPGSWGDLIRSVFALERELERHRRYPYMAMVRKQGLARLDSMFNYTRFHVYGEIEELGVVGQNIERLGIAENSLEVSVNFQAYGRDEQRLAGAVSMGRHKYTVQNVRALIGLYENVIAALVEGSQHNHYEQARYLPPGQYEQLRVQWNATALEHGRQGRLEELFSEQARRTPQALAVSSADGSLTYRQLEERSNQLAHYLRARGVGPEVVVGLCAPRSLKLVIGMLGILKAGGAYLPLDPVYPKERLAFMLADAQVPVLLTDSTVSDRVHGTAAHSVLLDEHWEQIEQEPRSALKRAGGPEGLAYLIYTSGSTGRPKGVSVEQRNAVAFIEWARRTFPEQLLSGVLASTSICFDLSVFEIFGPLSVGGELVLVPNGLTLSNVPLERVRLLNTVPSVMHELVRSGGIPPGVNRVFMCGEPVSLELAQALYGVESVQQVVNLYGPTECTTYSTWTAIPRHSTTAPSIGRPIGNTEVYVLDELQEVVPVGVAGELYIGGEGVSRGYLKRGALTAEKFVPDPFSARVGGRLYRTGDRVRYQADGELEFLGRADHQVKVRGYRIELGEIEAALLGHAEVQQAVVLAQETDQGGKQLVAYLVAGQTLPIAQLREYLSERVPEYMVPALFVQLEQLPLTANGKVDRQALPAPHASLTAARLYEPPQGATEEKLAQIWSEVLGVAAVGREDNFFELGGDSILSIQVKARAQEQGLDFALEDLFERQTIARLAQAIDGGAVTPSAEITPTAPFELIDASIRAQLPAQVEDAYPLSAMQLAMIYHSERAPDSGLYHDVISYRVPLAFEAGAFGQTLRSLTARHEVLRTGFELTRYGQPLQLVYREGEIDWEVVDLRACSVGEQQTRLQEWINREHLRPFAPGAWPWLRVVVHQLDGESFRLGWSFHHAVLDGWSEAALTTELIGTYAQALQGRCPARPALGVKYRQFVALEQRACTDERVVQFWAQQAQRARPTQLPERLLEQSGPARRLLEAETGLHGMIEITAAQTVALRKLARELDVPLKTVLLAVHLKVLSVACGQLQVTSGLITHGRVEAVQSEEAMGLFLNTLPMTLAVRPGSWGDLIRSVFALERELERHRRYPYMAMVRKQGLARLDSMFNYTRFHVYGEIEELGVVGQNIERLGIAENSLEVSVNFQAYGRDEQRLAGAVSMGRHKYTVQNVRALIGLYENVIAALVEGSQHNHYEQARYLPPGQYEQLRVQWNATALEHGRQGRLEELFSEQARRTPQALAVSSADGSLTYRQLEERSNQLAHYLRARGVGPEVVVGLCAPRSLKLVIGMLGILKAGGAYLPLDPVYPKERLAFMLADAQVPVLLTDSTVSDRVHGTAAHSVLLDEHWEQIEQEPRSALKRAGGPEGLAYLIYTSGSTGRPKGVSVEQRNAVAFIEWARRTFPEQLLSGVLASTSICFDLSVFEIFGPLSVGGELVLVPNGLTLSNVPLERVRLLNTVPSVMHELVRSGGIPPGVRAINLAGEPVSLELAQALYGVESVQQVVNLYGPTECTTYSTWTAIPRHSTTAPSIGRPIGNTEVYVLDELQEVVPVGVAGELYIGGEGVSRGYLKRGALTAEKFVPDPFSARVGGRLYRTGDRVRYQADGELEFLGRADHQVKVRGYRIELGEIEAALLGHAEVQQAVVLAQETDQGGKQLVAYLVAGQTLPIAQLREYLSERVPEYMVPALFVQLEQLPLTANGKVDRQALPAPQSVERPPPAYVAPRNALEEKLAQIWSEVLGVERVGIEDNFFELGGDSIQSIRIMSQASGAGININVRQIFEQRTVAKLAEVASSLSTVQAQQTLVEGAVQLTPIQHWFFEQSLPNGQHFNQAWLLQCRVRLQADRLQAALGHLIEHHDALRLRYRRTEHGWQQSHAVLSEEAVQRIDLSALSAEEQSQALGERARQLQGSLDLEHGPLMRVALIELGGGAQRLLWIIHHLVVDGVSWRILLEDLRSAYEQLQRGEGVSLPSKSSSYQSWAQRLGRYGQSEALQGQEGYWSEVLEAVRPLPVDHPQGDGSVGSSAAVAVSLTQEETQALLQEVPRAYRTQINDVLLTAVGSALTQWLGSERVVIDLEGHGREELFEELDVSRTVGWFTSVYPVALQVRADASVGERLKEVKEQLRQVPQRGVGYGVLRYLTASAQLAQRASPQVAFNYLGQMDQEITDTQWFGLAGESPGAAQDPHGNRKHEIEVLAVVVFGHLNLQWSYSSARYAETTIAALAGRFVASLREIIEHCRSHARDRPSDVLSLAGIEWDEDLLPDEATEALEYAPMEYEQGVV